MRNVDRPEVQKQMSMDEWLATRPPKIRAAAERFRDPAAVIRYKPTGQFADIHAFYETSDGVRMKLIMFNRGVNQFVLVFGIDPDDVEIVT